MDAEVTTLSSSSARASSRGLVRRGFVRGLEHDEPRRERTAAVLVEIDHRVVLVDFDERARRRRSAA